MTGPTIVARGITDADLAAPEAHRAGMALQFDQIAMDAFGRFNAINLRVVKVFA